VTHDLELVQLGKVFPNGTPAVVAFDLRVEKGEFVSFVGPSGCGKTTTLRMIAGFETATSGDILVRGRNISGLPPERRPTSTIFQNFALFPHMTVRQNIEYGLRVRNMSAAERRKRVDAMIERLELGPVADQRSTGLSGGQRQRVALARGLVVEPDILLLDEPLGALDANLRKTIQHQLKLLQRNLGITFVFVTHAQSEALTLSDRIVVMNRGRPEQISDPYELYTRPRSAFVARFIGRNTLLKGTVTDITDGIATLNTAVGPLRGSVNGAHFALGAAALLSIPSEALDIAEESQPGADPGTRLVGRLLGRTDLGTTVQIRAALQDGQEIVIENHRDSFPPGWSQGDAAFTWQAADATVVAAD